MASERVRAILALWRVAASPLACRRATSSASFTVPSRCGVHCITCSQVQRRLRWRAAAQPIGGYARLAQFGTTIRVTAGASLSSYISTEAAAEPRGTERTCAHRPMFCVRVCAVCTETSGAAAAVVVRRCCAQLRPAEPLLGEPPPSPG